MADDDDTRSSVSYSVKELLRDIKSSIDNLHGKVDSKADRSDVIQLAQEINIERQRINNIETVRAAEAKSRSSITEWKRWAWPLVFSALLAGMAVLTYFQSNGK